MSCFLVFGVVFAPVLFVCLLISNKTVFFKYSVGRGECMMRRTRLTAVFDKDLVVWILTIITSRTCLSLLQTQMSPSCYRFGVGRDAPRNDDFDSKASEPSLLNVQFCRCTVFDADLSVRQ